MHKCLGPDDCENLQDRRKPAIYLDKEPAIIVREPDATMQPTPQDNQLMSKHRILSFKPQLRLEWRGQDGQNETEQPDHSASLGDSTTSSTRIRFSVQTTWCSAASFPSAGASNGTAGCNGSPPLPGRSLYRASIAAPPPCSFSYASAAILSLSARKYMSWGAGRESVRVQ